jgi:hypothetical protein
MNRRTFFASLGALVVAPSVSATPAPDVRALLDALESRNRQMLARLDEMRAVMDRRSDFRTRKELA